MGNPTHGSDWPVTFETMTQMFREAVAAHPERIYVKTDETTLTYAASAGAIQSVVEGLGAQARGRSVVLVLENSPAFLIAYFAALFAGAEPVLVSFGHPDATVAKLIAGLDVAAILSSREIAGLTVTRFDDADVRRCAAPFPAEALPEIGTGDMIGAVLFSGGTTGLPKRVPHSHLTLARKVERMEWGWPTGEAEIWLPVAPFTHVYGFLMGVVNPVLRAGTLIIPPRFHPDLIVELLQREAVSVFGGGPPAIYQALMASQEFACARFPALRICPGGGAPFPMDVHSRWQDATGLPITEGYGMTEIAPITVNTVQHGMKPGAAGKPCPGTHVEIVDIQTGEIVLDPGQVGEIRVRGPHQMTGYAGNAQETALSLRDGYVYTGDIGVIDEDGFLIIQDRKKDVIFVKGFNVFPREIEETLMSHDAVASGCVVGRADTRSGERPVGYVTLREPCEISVLLDHCQAHLAAYKLPAGIVVMEALPLTPAGKVDRVALRKRAAEG